MKKYSGWRGINEDVMYLVRAILNSESPSIADSYPDLSKQELRSLFCAALATNIVTSEIAGNMEFQYENGEMDRKSEKSLMLSAPSIAKITQK